MEHRGGGNHRIGRWLPNQDALEDWLEGLLKDTRARRCGAKLHPAVEGFRVLIDSDPFVRLLIAQMIEHVPDTKQYTKMHLKGIDQMLLLIEEVIGRAPEYSETGLVGVPLHAALDWCMATPAGFDAFRHDAIDGAFRNILRAWCEFRCSPNKTTSLPYAN